MKKITLFCNRNLACLFPEFYHFIFNHGGGISELRHGRMCPDMGIHVTVTVRDPPGCHSIRREDFLTTTQTYG